MKLEDDFSNIEEFEEQIKAKGCFVQWEQFQEKGSLGFSYQELRDYQEIFKPFGLIFDFDLSADAFDFEIN